MQRLSSSQLGSEFIDWPVYMRCALDLAVTVINTSPNPRVGCVIVKAGGIVGKGWHVSPGKDHAEIMALKSAGEDAKSSTVFVSLEPCSHIGRTGPCCDALIDAGISRLVIAGIDPNPEISGLGIKKIESAGIEVFYLEDSEAAARKINVGYFKRRETGLPYVRCKLAASLDGRTALSNGVSKWITSAEARADVQLYRAQSSAIITGVETVLSDNPSMNVRFDELNLTAEEKQQNLSLNSIQPLRVILDSNLRTPGTAKILHVDGGIRIYVAKKTIDQELVESKELPGNVELVFAEEESQRVNLHFVLESLALNCECNEVFVEAGPALSAAFLEAGLIDELIVYIAPKLLGSDAKPLFEIAGLQSMSESRNFAVKDLDKVGDDIRVCLIPQK